jgi:hypothetical protein
MAPLAAESDGPQCWYVIDGISGTLQQCFSDLSP